MTSFLDRIYDFAKCNHDQVTVLGLSEDKKQYSVKCCKCGETVSLDVIANREPDEPSVPMTEEVKDYDPQY